MAVSVSLNGLLRYKINMALLQTNSRAADFWVRQRAFTMKTLLDFTRWAKHSKPKSASNQTWYIYWQDQSTRHQKKYFSHWFAVINCGFPQKLSNNITLVLLFLVICLLDISYTMCWMTFIPYGLLWPTGTPTFMGILLKTIAKSLDCIVRRQVFVVKGFITLHYWIIFAISLWNRRSFHLAILSGSGQ